jgi:hypothetical protein
MTDGFVYGLRVRTTLAIPGLPSTPPTGEPDVHVHLGDSIADLLDAAEYETIYVSPILDDAELPVVTVSRRPDTGWYRWVYSDGPRFVLEPTGRTVWCDWINESSLDDVALYLLGPILGFILRMRGVTCLHASCVSINGRALALVGPPSAGKSTTAAALVRAGYQLVSEDVVPLVERHGEYDVIPGYPRVRLWPRAVRMVFGPQTALPHLTQKWDKRRLDLHEHDLPFSHEPVRLAAVYYLARRSWNDQAPVVLPADPGDALMKLVADSYTPYALTKEMRAREFALLGRLTRTVPMRLVVGHKDPSRLARLRDLISADMTTLVRDAAPAGHASTTLTDMQAP